jgi:hypothetical protein
MIIEKHTVAALIADDLREALTVVMAEGRAIVAALRRAVAKRREDMVNIGYFLV